MTYTMDLILLRDILPPVRHYVFIKDPQSVKLGLWTYQISACVHT